VLVRLVNMLVTVIVNVNNKEIKKIVKLKKKNTVYALIVFVGDCSA